MKTAEETLKQFLPNQFPAAGYFIDNVSIEDVLEAMKSYAKAAIEEQLKVTAEETMYAVNEYLNLMSPSIGEEDILTCTRIDLR